MNQTVLRRSSVLIAALVVGMIFGGSVVSAADIGPLPLLKINKVKAELGKRLFFDKRISGDVGPTQALSQRILS